MKFTALILLLLLSLQASAQQDQLYTMFWNHYAIFNPASSGLFYKHQAAATFRDQWEGVNGAPQTIAANYNVKLDFLHGGLGVSYVHDKIGFVTNQRANLNYSYHFQLGEKGILAAGVSAGIFHFSTDDYFIPPTNASDPMLPKGNAFIMNLGVVYKTDKLNIGLSSTNLNEPKIKNAYYSTARHYYLNANYLLELPSEFDLKPQVLLRADEVKFSMDVNLLAYYKKQYWLGVSYRTTDAIAFMAGSDIKEKFRIGYSYDLTINQLSSISRGSHEIVAAFLLK